MLSISVKTPLPMVWFTSEGALACAAITSGRMFAPNELSMPFSPSSFTLAEASPAGLHPPPDVRVVTVRSRL